MATQIKESLQISDPAWIAEYEGKMKEVAKTKTSHQFALESLIRLMAIMESVKRSFERSIVLREKQTLKKVKDPEPIPSASDVQAVARMAATVTTTAKRVSDMEESEPMTERAKEQILDSFRKQINNFVREFVEPGRRLEAMKWLKDAVDQLQ